MDKPPIPSGFDHLRMLNKIEAITHNQSMEEIKADSIDEQMIGTALSTLYQAATCHRECQGGPHILEALCGRIYNLGAAAYILTLRGFYDEALNLTRSIGEISNLIALSVVDKRALAEWLSSDKKTRISKFGPSAIRKMLSQQEPPLLLADDDWYSRFCEAYTHITPQTKPNMHNDSNQPVVGGIYQPEGLSTTLGELATLLGAVALIVCGYFKLADLSEEISTILASAEQQPDDETI